MTNKSALKISLSAILLGIFLRAENNSIATFDQGMANYKKCYSSDLCLNDPEWALLKQLYDTFLLNNDNPSSDPLIPKIIHQIWLGSALPEKCKKLQESWIKLHPSWEYKLWQEAEIEAFGLQNKALYDAATNYGEKSDIARYEILYRVGGLYIDTDFECLTPFDFFHHRCTFYTGLCIGKDKKTNFANGLIGSAPNHPILKQCIDQISNQAVKRNDAIAIMNRTGPYFFTRCFFDVIKDCSLPVIVLPGNYFYPWPHYHRKENTTRQIRKWLRPESFAIHYWHRSWAS